MASDCVNDDEASEFVVDYEKIGIDDEAFKEIRNDYYLNDELIGKINKYIKNAKLPIKRGDTVILGDLLVRYRNELKLIYDGISAIELSDYPDDYGVVPEHIKITDNDFDIGWWNDVITHNNIFWLSDEIIGRLVFKKNNNFVESKISIKGKEYIVIIDGDVPEDLEWNDDELKLDTDTTHGEYTLFFDLLGPFFDLELEKADCPDPCWCEKDGYPVFFLKFISKRETTDDIDDE